MAASVGALVVRAHMEGGGRYYTPLLTAATMVLDTLVFNYTPDMPDELALLWFFIHWFSTICLKNWRCNGS